MSQIDLLNAEPKVSSRILFRTSNDRQ